MSTGKEITLSSSDRLASFVCAGVPTSPDGGEKCAAFQGWLISHPFLHFPGNGSGASSSGLWSPATPALKERTLSMGFKASARTKLRHACRARSTQWTKATGCLLSIVRGITAPSTLIPAGKPLSGMTWGSHQLFFFFFSTSRLSLLCPVGMLFFCKPFAEVFFSRSLTVPSVFTLKWFLGKVVRLQQRS